MRESGPFQSKTRKRSNYMHVTILHGFSTYCSLRPKSELRRPFRALQGWKMDWQVFVAHGKPVWSVLWLVSQINTSSHVGLLKKACVSVVFNENIFKLVVPMHKHFFSRERVSQCLIVALLSFRWAASSSQKSFKIISFLASWLSFSLLLFIYGHTCLISFLFLVLVFLLVAFVIVLTWNTK